MPVVNCKLGKDVTVIEPVNLYGCQIGDDSSVGPFSEIQKEAVIGNKVKIQSHSFICQGVTIEDEVFIGHGVIMTNDKYPQIDASKWVLEKTLIKKGASIGSGTVLLPVTIGEGAIIGAGSVVTKDIPAKEVWAGNPARFLKRVV